MKRFLCLYILLLPCIVFLVIYLCYFCYMILPVPTYSLQRLYLWLLSFGLIFLSFVSGIIALTVYGALYAAKMSLIEASIWNLAIKIFYLFIYIVIFFFVAFMMDYWKSALWGYIITIWIPLLFWAFFSVISGAFSAIIYGASCRKSIWPTGIVILYDVLSFILGIDLVIAIIHLCKCCIIEKKKF